MRIDYELKTIRDFYMEIQKERDDALNEIDILREILLEVRCMCFDEYAVNELVIKEIEKAVKRRLKYTHESWFEDFSYGEDKDGKKIRIKVANRTCAKVMEKGASRSWKEKTDD